MLRGSSLIVGALEIGAAVEGDNVGSVGRTKGGNVGLFVGAMLIS